MNGYEFNATGFHAQGPGPRAGYPYTAQGQEIAPGRKENRSAPEPAFRTVVSIFRGTLVNGDVKSFDACESFMF